MPRPDMPSLLGRSPSSLSLSPPRSCLSFLSHSRIRVTRLAPRTTVLLLVVVEKQRVGGPHRRFPSRASFFPLPRSVSSSSVCLLFSLVYVLVRKLHRAGCLPFILPSVILPSSAAGIRDTATLSATASQHPDDDDADRCVTIDCVAPYFDD